MVKRPLGLSASTSSKKSKRMTTNFNPTSSLASTSTSTATTTEETERTYPLDSDSLTLKDLFSLQENSLELINLTSYEKSEETQEELNGLLRGILHGINSLELLSTASTTSTEEAGTSTGQEPSSLASLGLSHPLAPIQLLYLQAFSLFNLSSLLPPPPSALPSALDPSSSAGPNAQKKKLATISEPTDPKEWLELSVTLFTKALELIKGVQVDGTGEGGKEREREKDRLELILVAELIGANCSLAERSFRASATTSGDVKEGEEVKVDEKGLEILKKIEKDLEPLISLLVKTSHSDEAELEIPDDDEEDTTMVILPPSQESLSVLTSLSSYINVLDQNHNIGTLAYRSTLLKAIGPILLLVEDEVLEKALMVTAELVMSRFVLEEEILEEKYRPDDDDEEDKVVPLPDEQDVREVKSLGLNGTDLLFYPTVYIMLILLLVFHFSLALVSISQLLKL